MTKSQLRAAVSERLRGMTPQARQEKSALLRAQAAPWLRSGGLRVCIYAPLEHEVNVLPLMQEYADNAYYFPRCLPGRAMRFHHVTNPANELIPGALGILAPLPHMAAIQPEEADVIIVPGVAFTAAGLRLGYGGGYYDRYLPRCPQAQTLALAFAEQMVPEIPTDEHDLPVGCVLSA